MLPTEVRILIYMYCLVPGRVTPLLKGKIQLTCLSLLRTCKKIFREAESEFFGHNTIVLSSYATVQKLIDECLGLKNGPHDQVNYQRLRQRASKVQLLEISLSAADLTEKDREDAARKARSRPSPAWGSIGFRGQCRLIHQQLKIVLRNVRWSQMILPILRHLRPRQFSLDLGQCKCHIGCCWLLVNGLSVFSHGFVLGAPDEIVIKGLQESWAPDLAGPIREWTFALHHPNDERIASIEQGLQRMWAEVQREETKPGCLQ